MSLPRDLTAESVDVVVVGAGPTGLACGIELECRDVRAADALENVAKEVSQKL